MRAPPSSRALPRCPTRTNRPDSPDSTGQPPDSYRTQPPGRCSRQAGPATLSDVNQEIAESAGAEQARHFPNFSVLLSSTPRGARLARLLTTEQLRTWGLPLHPAEHIVAELASNAVTHGRVPGRDFRLTLHVVGSTLRIEVTDTRRERLPTAPTAGPWRRVRPRPAPRGRTRGRWGVREDRFPRKTVWAELRCSEPEPAPTGPGAAGDPHSKNRGEKEPHQAPPLPPTAHAHSHG